MKGGVEMNIAEAKEQIIRAMKAYFTKDEFGRPVLPPQKQRPIFLIGPPGIGKTAVMEQIAQELGVGLVSYSMTHHTRQSALGLPYISEKTYNGFSYRVSEYTMSEIIGAVYDKMRQTGVTEGILFLDEINCVSETLAPCMLQFLQYKVFGQHRVPDGWIVVTAGNPPEYNKSVRDFDIVTWDRLKRICVEPDYDAWKAYAKKKGVHPVITTYLEVRRKDFYKTENTADGMHFVTARSWDDLSDILKLYEKNEIPADELLFSQYLQDPKICRDFSIYYDLFQKYRNDYKIEAILCGEADEEVCFRAQRAGMDERISLLGLIFDAVTEKLRNVCRTEDVMELLAERLRLLRDEKEEMILSRLEEEEDFFREKERNGREASSCGEDELLALCGASKALSEIRAQLAGDPEKSREEGAFACIRCVFGQMTVRFEEQTREAGQILENVFSFCEKAFGEGDELLLLVTELTASYYCARFIGHFGCESYYHYNRQLQFEERGQSVLKRVNELDWSFQDGISK